MGDGGVACMPLQQHTNINIMERFPDKTTTTTAHCNNNTGTSSGGNKSTAAAATSVKNESNGISDVNKSNENKNGAAAATSNGTGLKTKKVVKRIVKVKKVVTVKKPVHDKSVAVAEKGRKGIENGLSSVACKVQGNKEEVEEGELGTLKSPPRVEAENGEPALQEKPRRSEIEKGDVNGEKWRKGDAERGEATLGKFLRKGEIARDSRDNIEKGEFVPDRWQSKGGEYVYGKPRGRYEMSRDCTPPSGKYFNEDSFRRKDFSRSGSIQLSKSSIRWEGGHDRNSGRINSKIVDEEGSYKSEYSNGKNHVRDHPLGNRLKRVGTDSSGIERKHFGDYGDYMSLKSRRMGEDGSRALPLEHYSRHSGEKFYKGSGSSSSRISSLDKYSSRHNEPTLSSKLVYDRHGRSPGHSERSPFDKARYYDHRDRSPLPVRRERSPYGRERSPYGGERTPYGRERSPFGGERTPYGRERSPYGHGKSPVGREKSPHDRGRNYEHRRRSPVCSERSPQDRARHHHSRRDRTPSYVERSPLDRRSDGPREASRKSGANEKRNSQKVDKRQEDKVIHRDSGSEDVQVPDKESQSRGSAVDPVGADEKDAICESHNDEHSQIPVVDVKESPRVDGPPPEELLSMEEDMDICDTPPHIPAVPESSMGKWYYLDYSGVEQGPSRLFDLKTLVDDGVLVPDHFIKHMESDRWVTIENAVSPLMTLNFPSIVPEALTQLVSPPEATGNLLAVADTGDIGQTSIKNGEEIPTTSSQPQANLCDSAAASEPLQDLLIDARVGALLEGFPVIPGRELDTIGEALQMAFELVPTEEWEKLEGLTWHQTCSAAYQDSDELSRCSDLKTKEDVEEQLSASFDPDQGFNCSFDVADWFSGPWSCKGGDWKRQDDAVQDRLARRKLVLNDGFPLCQMPKAGSEDPRWHRKDDFYCPSQSRRLDLPLWACSCSDEKNEAVGKLTITKPPVARGLKGTVLPVVRINACVVKDHGSFISESRSKARGKDRYSSRSNRMFCATNDVKRPSIEGDFLCKAIDDQESNCTWKSNVSINIPKDRLCTVHDLQLHLGDWYYLDGAGHEQGPRSISELQVLVDQGFIQKYSSVFRKSDRLWIPVPSRAENSEPRLKADNAACLNDLSNIFSQSIDNDQTSSKSSFHSLHPQFIGYTRGKLHELVMKAYKSREFAAAINEVLDPWISAKLPKKEIEEHMYWKSDMDGRSSKRARILDDECAEGYELEEDLDLVQRDETPFEELCGDAAFIRDETACSGTEMGSWGLLDGRMLARVFHFLRFDLKSLAFASLTCKHWRAAVGFYKDISRQVDFSSVGPDCTDSMIWNIMNGYNRQRINSMVLIRCTNITSGILEQIVFAFPYLSSIDVRGCSQFMDLACQFPNLSWVKSRNSRGARISEESHSRMKSLKQISENAGVMNDFSVEEYIESGNKRDSAKQLFRRSLYKRSKLFDARKSSSILSRDARLRRWAMKKSEYDYKRMEGFLASGLKDIMKKNNIEIFVPKVAEIEDKMKNGYYRSHGLRSVKEDIRRMCRDAEKARIRGGGEISHISGLFYKLASLLEKSLKFSYERDELMKSWKDDLSGSSSMKYKKKSIAERRLSRSNRKSMDSGSDTSDDFDKSFAWGDSESTASDTESDLDFRPEGRTGESRGDGYYTADDSSYCGIDEREWGARMTKESLVPPVTRKYEVIDCYVVVADEEDVQRKMCVSLPDDYADKLDAQKNGTEELDMELPEVKDYRPRKQLGDEVIEQEVYGIDPYTHNLLLDSMPDELEWTLLEKHLFIEDVLLRTLNKQVRHFTGTGNTPMMYPLQPVIQEIEKAAEANCDIQTTKMCWCILKAIDSRRDDHYVAYRKGLGVVCNKEGGFGEEDFVVEFLGEVYPAWKWFEKQDGIRSLQKDSEDPAPEFYNIYLERPKGDADGYDLVVVDAMHKANYASRICHSCRPNCEAKVTAVAGQYQIGIYTVREIQFGEEITFDYNSVTESKEEYEASVCLCGSQVCRGSYLNLTGEGAFQKVLKERHGMLDRHHLMIEACQLNCVSEEDYVDLGKAGLGSCLLGGLPDWVVAYSARLVRFINLERTKLPAEILRHNLEEKGKYSLDISMEVEKSDAEVQAEGVYNQRLQNLAVTLDKVRYVMRCVFGDPKRAPPPLEKLSPVETVSFLWKGEGSVVEELLQCMAPHMERDMLNSLKSKIQAHDPSDSDDISRALRKSLLWLRDELRSLPCTYKCRHDAAADLIHMYAYTKFFFRVRKYKTFTSPPVYISPLDLGPKYADKLGSGNHEYRKTYGENYCMGQLIFWHIQTNAEPDCSLDRAIRGCLSLPNVASFYSKFQKPSQHRVYSPKMLKDMLERMEKYPQKPWPKDQIWSFKNFPDVFGSPMLDSVLTDSPVDKEMINWLKQRSTVFQAMWDTVY